MLKFTKLTVMLFFLCGINLILAQGTLYIKEKAGANKTFALNSIQKIIFSNGNMNVNLKTGSPSSYAFSDLQRASFVDYDLTLSALEISYNNSNVLLYPNPVSDIINLSISASKNGFAQVEILDLQGKMLSSQNFSIQSGNTQISIPASSLVQGIYVCRIQQDGLVNLVKFIK